MKDIYISEHNICKYQNKNRKKKSETWCERERRGPITIGFIYLSI